MTVEVTTTEPARGKIVTLEKGRKMQEVACTKCGGFAMHKMVDWKPRKHNVGVVCRKCCDHLVSRGTTTRKVGQK